jgi:hypothetical protein
VPIVINTEAGASRRDQEVATQMLELAPFGLTGLVAILLVAFFFACKDDSASFSDKHSSPLLSG